MAKDLVRCDGCGEVANKTDMQKSWLILRPFSKPDSSGSMYSRMFGSVDDDEPRYDNRNEECGGEFCSPRCVLAFCALFLEVVEFADV